MLLVLDSRMYKRKAWLRVALPDRPNGSSGWIREDFVRLSTTSWRITVNRAAHTVTVYRDGRKQRSFKAVIGKPGDADARAGSTRSTRSSRSPTRRASSAPGRCISRRSPTCSSTTAAGRAASRSTVATARAWPIRSARRRSHGCMRVDDANIVWMARVVPLGTPVLII